MFNLPIILGQDLFKEVYEKKKEYLYFPFVCFPVKLRTYLGEPLYCGAEETPAEFAERVSSQPSSRLKLLFPCDAYLYRFSSSVIHQIPLTLLRDFSPVQGESCDPPVAR